MLIFAVNMMQHFDIRHFSSWEQGKPLVAFYTTGNIAWGCNWAVPNDDSYYENYPVLAKAIGVPMERMVRGPQKHSANVRVITQAEAGEGVARFTNLLENDGLVTDVPHVLLCTVQADCLPVYLYDTPHRAIGMVHSGWRGTLQGIAPHALEVMHEAYGTLASDVQVLFGPSICGPCYQVGAELRESFLEAWGGELCAQTFAPDPESESGKYRFDNAFAARLTLVRAGVPEGNIVNCGVCTFESPELASYRRTGDLKGRMLTGIMITA